MLKKETKIYGGVMGKDIFLYEDDYIANLIHNAPNPLPPGQRVLHPGVHPDGQLHVVPAGLLARQLREVVASRDIRGAQGRHLGGKMGSDP